MVRSSAYAYVVGVLTCLCLCYAYPCAYALVNWPLGIKNAVNIHSQEMQFFSAFNKGGDPIWYYNSQSLKPAVQEKFKETQIIPFDNPP